MALMVACGVLVLLGLVATVRWGGYEVRESDAADAEGSAGVGAGPVLRDYVRSLTIAVVAGLGAGVVIAGAGGRLAMRLLAVTAGDDVQGRITEADEVVGRITADGTIGFVIFTALFFGLATGALYVLLHRFLPGGRWAGVAFGGLLLVLAATRIDPLRADNEDFDIVGPGWLSVLVFGALVVVHGMVVAALAGRYSRALPPLSGNGRVLLAYAPLLLLLLIPIGVVVLILIGLLLVIVKQSRADPGLFRSRPWLRGGQVVLVGMVLVAAPGFVSATADILGCNP